MIQENHTRVCIFQSTISMTKQHFNKGLSPKGQPNKKYKVNSDSLEMWVQ